MPSPQTIEKIKKITKKLLPLTGIILLISLLINIGLDKITETMMKISPFYIIIAISLSIPAIIIGNYLSQLILRKQKINVSNKKSIKIMLIGYFYCCLTPGYLGHLARIPYLKDETKEPTGKLFVNSTMVSLVNVIPRCFIVIIGALLLMDKISEIVSYTVLVFVILIILSIYFLKKERGEKTLSMLIKIFVPKKIKPYFYNFIGSFYLDFPKIKELIIPFLLYIPLWILFYSRIYLVGLALGIDIPFYVFIFIYPLISLVKFIPISSGGLGIREAAVIFVFSLYGIPAHISVALSLGGYLVTDVLTGIYGLGLMIKDAEYINISFKAKKSNLHVK